MVVHGGSTVIIIVIIIIIIIITIIIININNDKQLLDEVEQNIVICLWRGDQANI